MDKEQLVDESETVRHRRLRNQEKWPKLQTFVYDSKREKILGSDVMDWSKSWGVTSSTGVSPEE